ncbi:MAG: hypothetical protein EXR73_08100 [Myxococcales bacterium]|nr:hypothetical protein [Myxococcales bacterium]
MRAADPVRSAAPTALPITALAENAAAPSEAAAGPGASSELAHPAVASPFSSAASMRATPAGPKVSFATPPTQADPADEVQSGRLGPTQVAVTLGEGDDRVSLVVRASGETVQVRAAVATPAAAEALRGGASELRDALARHGLQLSQFSAGAGGRQGAPARERRQDDDPDTNDEPPDETPGRGRSRGVRVII